MREIMFRGKRTDNGDWVCSGNLIQFFDNNIREVYISQYGERCNAVHDIDTDNIEKITCKNGARFYKVNPDTVGQYTGQVDKNKVKIFENDVVQYISDYDFKCKAIVRFGEYSQDGSFGEYDGVKCLGWFVEVIDYEVYTLLDDEYFKLFDYLHTQNLLEVIEECEVIGNIADNPELLESQRKDELSNGVFKEMF